jgi:hypothetical protein
MESSPTIVQQAPPAVEHAPATEPDVSTTSSPHIIRALTTTPQANFEAYSKRHQLTYTKVVLASLMKNNKHQANFLNDFYESVIHPFRSHADIRDDEDYAALVSYYHNHMVNTGNYADVANSSNGKKATRTPREARTASFQYCMQELLPEIQKKLRRCS